MRGMLGEGGPITYYTDYEMASVVVVLMFYDA